MNGETLPGLYTPAGVRQGVEAAHAAAEEIVAGRADMVSPTVRTVLRLGSAGDDVPLLCDRLLRATPGVCLTNSVTVGGAELGRTEHRGELIQTLQSFIRNQMPSWAKYGVCSGDVSFTPMYARSGTETDHNDLVLLITGMAPVLYTDGEGYVSWA